MKRFAIQCILFLIPIVLIAFVADSVISHNLKKSGLAIDEYSVWNDIYDGKINSDILIYGGSRAWQNIDPTIISDSLKVPAYNIGIDGHNFWLQYLRHKLLLKYNTKPKLIIYSLDIFTLKKRPDLYNSEQFLPYMLFNSEMRNATITYNGYNYLDYELPLIRYYGKKESIFAAIPFLKNTTKNDAIRRIKGYVGWAKPWDNREAEEREKKQSNYAVSLDSSTIVLFKNFLNECKQDNIKIVFVYTPEYIEAQKFPKNRGEIMALYTKFSKEYNIPFYDYSGDTMSLTKNYFFDSMHLNKAGGELFTNKLIKQLRSNKELYTN